MNKSFIAAMAHYFGKLPNQTTGQMLAEIRTATDSDRSFWINGLEQNGYVISDK